MLGRKTIIGQHHGQAGFGGEHPRAALMRFGAAKGKAAAMHEQDRALARAGRHENQKPRARRAERGVGRHEGFGTLGHLGHIDVPAAVARLRQGAPLGWRQGRRVGLRPVLARHALHQRRHVGREVGGQDAHCSCSGKTFGPKSTIVAM